MKLKSVRGKLLCGLLAGVMVSACACGKSTQNADVTPTAEITQEVTPGTENPTPSEEPSVTPTVSAEPTPTAEVTPTNSVTPEVAAAFPDKALLTPLAMKEPELEKESLEILKDDPVAGAERGTVSNLLIRYVGKNGETEMFDSIAYAERMQETCKKRSDELLKEMAAAYKGKVIVSEKLLEKIELGDSWSYYNAYINIYEHAVYGAPGTADAKAADSELPLIFKYQVDFVFENGSEIRGILCEDLMALNKAAENAAIRAGFRVQYEMKPYGDDQWEYVPAFTEASLTALMSIPAGDADSALSKTRNLTSSVYVLPTGQTILYVDKETLPYREYELVTNAAVTTADGKVLYAEGAKDIFLNTTIADIRTSFLGKFHNGGDIPVPGFAEKAELDIYGENQVYTVETELGNGRSIAATASRKNNETANVSVILNLDGLQNVYETSLLPVEELIEKDQETIEIKEYWAETQAMTWGGYDPEMVILSVKATDKNNTVAEFQSDRYAAAHWEQFEKNAAAYKKELQAAFKDNILVRERLLETIPIGKFGKVLVTEHAAIGYAESEDSNTLFSYSVKFSLEYTNDFGVQRENGEMYVQRDRWNGTDLDGGKDCQYDERIRVAKSVLQGEPLTEVICESDWMSPERYSYDDEAYYNMAWFDKDGKPVLYMEDSWGEATDWFRTPGDEKIIGADGKVIYSLKDNILFGYHLSDLSENLRTAEVYDDASKINYTAIPKGSVSMVKTDDYTEFTFRDSMVVDKNTKLIYEAYGHDRYFYKITLVYNDEEIELTDNRFESTDVFGTVTDEMTTGIPATIRVEHTENEYHELAYAEMDEVSSFPLMEEEIRSENTMNDFRYDYESYSNYCDWEVPDDLRQDIAYDYRRSFLDSNGKYRRSEYYRRNADGSYQEIARLFHSSYGDLLITEKGDSFGLDISTFDENGNCVYTRTWHSGINTYTYDGEGRLLTRARYTESGMLCDCEEYTYDENGCVTKVVFEETAYINGQRTSKSKTEYSYEFDSQKRLASITIDYVGQSHTDPHEKLVFKYLEDGTVMCTVEEAGQPKKAALFRPDEKGNEILQGKNITADFRQHLGYVLKSGNITVGNDSQVNWVNLDAAREYKDNLLTKYTVYQIDTGTAERFIWVYEYNQKGLVTKETCVDKSVGASPVYIRTFTYDSDGRVGTETIEYMQHSTYANLTESHAYNYLPDGSLEMDSAVIQRSSGSVYTVVRKFSTQ